ncbi:ATP phosphoribosyltransferase regulatory subunit [Chloroflexota bacterium]
MRVQRCRGSRDLSPEEMRRFRLIEEIFQDCCLKAGYEEVRTPTLEYLHLFTTTGTLTPGRLHRVYSFLDWDGWSGERVVLRPDGTIPVARFYIESMGEKELAKLFYISSVFIFEETGTKTREWWQCGAELIGAGSAAADAELITLSLEILHKLQIGDIELRLSHVGLVRALLEEVGLSRSEQTRIFDRIMDEDVDTLRGIKPKRPELARVLSHLLELKGNSSGFLQNFKAQFKHEVPKLEPFIHDFLNIVGLLDALGYDYQIDIASGAGFEYYTGMTFQLFRNGEKIGGGGRYDALIPLLGGRSVPASGFALYLDALMNWLPPASLPERPADRILVSTETSEPEALQPGFTLVGLLREAGYVAELKLGPEALSNFRWTIAMQNKAPIFVLTDRVTQRRFEVQTTTEVLALLKEEGANKTGTAQRPPSG